MKKRLLGRDLEVSEIGLGCMGFTHAYSMMAREHESLFPVLEELNIGFVAFSPLANGILTDAFKAGDTFTADDYRSIMPQYSEESFEKNRDLFVLIRDLAREKAATPAQISGICKTVRYRYRIMVSAWRTWAYI